VSSDNRGRIVSLVARREATLLRRSRAGRVAALLIFAVAWLPPILVSLREGRLGLASFAELTPLALAISGVVVPLLALLAGCGLFAGEIEDGTLVPVVCLPVARSVCYLGKLLGIGLVLGTVSALAFGSVAAAVLAVRGPDGGRDYITVSIAGMLLGTSSLLIGAVLGARGQGRVRAYGAALVTWLVLVFALDAILLAAVLATAPPAPESVGHHGHDELSSPVSPARGLEPERGPTVSIGAAWMAVDPVSLFRWSGLAFGPRLGARFRLAPGSSAGGGAAAVIGLGWLFWIVAPGVVGWRRFRRVSLG
jgi:ABC-type transport system involved in multi-copper enzyme maturation permease subunit